MDFIDKFIGTQKPVSIRINGDNIESSEILDVTSPYSKEIVGRVFSARESDIDNAVSVAKSALVNNVLEPYQRASILDRASLKLQKYKEDFARLISLESAKPIKTARVEVDRAIQTFIFAAAAARTITGEMVALDSHPTGVGKLGFTFREPIGVVAAISPFNFPLNLVAHKIAPAIAAGCPTVLKPAQNTPLTAAALVSILIDEANLDGSMLGFVPCPGNIAARFSELDDVAMISFTGSPPVGWSIKQAAPKKKVVLELGNNAPVIIEADADIEKAAASMASSGYSFQGQSCISVQRVYVQSVIYEDFINVFKNKVDALVIGDPLVDNTDVSSLITTNETQRVLDWINQACANGARLVTGGELTSDSVLKPTILADTTDDMEVCRKEVFGPLVSVMKYETLDEAIKRSNDTAYGLQASIFTTNISNALKAARTLDFGGVLINETPTYRADNMPYGGIRDSGNTKEGPANSVHEMTVEKLVVITED